MIKYKVLAEGVSASKSTSEPTHAILAILNLSLTVAFAEWVCEDAAAPITEGVSARVANELTCPLSSIPTLCTTVAPLLLELLASEVSCPMFTRRFVSLLNLPIGRDSLDDVLDLIVDRGFSD